MRLRLVSFLSRGLTVRFTSNKCSPKAIIQKCESCLAPNYSPFPVLLDKGKGVYLYDIEGKEYLDFLAGYATVSVGHSHPKLHRAVAGQVKRLTLPSRAFYCKTLCNYAEYLSQLFCFDKVLPVNTGTEAAESAVKIARIWGYKVKGIASNQAKVLFPENNYWGNSLAAISASTDPVVSADCGPYVPGFDTVPFNNAECLMEKLKDPNVCAFMVEPIQAEAGIVVPDMSYLKKVRDLCTENNVLLIADEIICGLGRAGNFLCCDTYQIRPDMLLLGKSLSGGILPVSAVLADQDVMNVLEPNSHLSTYGGSPLSCRVAATVLKIILDERLPENAKDMGLIFREELCDLPRDVITEVRGMGLLNAIVVHNDVDAEEFCRELMRNGLLTQPPNRQVIRLTPPLTIKEKEILKASQIIRKCVESLRRKEKCEKKCPKNGGRGSKKPKKRPRKHQPDC